MKYIERSYQPLYSGMLINFAFFGISAVIPGMLLPHIIRDMGWNYSVTGAVLAAGSIGYFLSTFLCGFLVRIATPRIVIVIGLLIESAGLLLFGSHPAMLLNVMFNFLIGFGQGSLEVVVNYAVVRMERHGESHLMSFVHAAFSIGAAAGPVIGSLILGAFGGWRNVFIGAAVISFLIMIMNWFLPYYRVRFSDNSEDSDPENNTEPISMRSLFQPMIFFSVITILIYVGVEIGTSNWISEYFVSVLGTSKETASFTVTLFWGGILAGRILVPILARKVSLAIQLIALSILVTLALFLTVMFVHPAASTAGFLLAGIGCSSIYPLVMTLVGQHYKQNQSVYLGMVSTGGGIGSFLFPLGMALISDAVGLRGGFAFFGVTGLVMILAAFGIRREVLKRDR